MTQSHITAVVDEKGGTGKTTLSMNLGAAFAHAGHATAVIDLDPAAHSLRWAGRRGPNGPKYPAVFGANPSNLRDDLAGMNFTRFVCDTPGALGAEMVAAIDIADLIIVPLQPSAIDLDALANTVAMIERRKARETSTLFLLWRASNKRARAVGDIRQHIETLPGVLLEPFSTNLEDWQLSARWGGTILDLTYTSPAREELDAIAAAVEAHITSAATLEAV